MKEMMAVVHIVTLDALPIQSVFEEICITVC